MFRCFSALAFLIQLLGLVLEFVIPAVHYISLMIRYFNIIYI